MFLLLSRGVVYYWKTICIPYIDTPSWQISFCQLFLCFTSQKNVALKRIQSLQLFTCGKQLLIFTLCTHALLVEAIAHSERPFTTLTTLALPAFCKSHRAYPAKFVIFECNFKREKSDLQH